MDQMYLQGWWWKISTRIPVPFNWKELSGIVEDKLYGPKVTEKNKEVQKLLKRTNLVLLQLQGYESSLEVFRSNSQCIKVLANIKILHSLNFSLVSSAQQMSWWAIT